MVVKREVWVYGRSTDELSGRSGELERASARHVSIRSLEQNRILAHPLHYGK